MAALSSDIDLTLSVQRTGISADLVRDALSLADQPFDEMVQQFIEVAAGASDQAVSLGPLTTCQTLLLISTQTLTAKINGETTGHACKNMLLTGASLTGLTLSNAGSVVAAVRTVMLGV